MTRELLLLIKQLNDKRLHKAEVIRWASPIISFGDFTKSKVATLGLNPSNKEFVDKYGNELTEINRRFHTLQSLHIDNWNNVSLSQLKLIWNSCKNYFSNNPYDGWFKKLDFILSGTGASYYLPVNNACHLDLIPYATSKKWMELTSQQRLDLLEMSGSILGIMLANSPIRVLILNGQTVVDNLQKLAGCKFHRKIMPDWNLQRKKGDAVLGVAYTGIISNVGAIELKKNIKILGYNHNLQSSYGISNVVQSSIRGWITLNINHST